jgi:hypothetical protein
VHEEKAAPSKLHLSVEGESVEENENDALVEVDALGGWAVIVVSGGVESYVKLRVALHPDAFPAVSCAFACQSYVPSASVLGVQVAADPVVTVEDAPLITNGEHCTPAPAGVVQMRN